MAKVVCPDCHQQFKVSPQEAPVGEIIECPHCGAELEVTKANRCRIQTRLILEEK